MIEATDEVVLWGDGSPTREFLYVDDCADGLLLAAERYDGAEPVNLGTGVETSIRELAETIAELTGFEGEIVWDTSMPNGQPRRQLDASRAERAVRLPRAHDAPRRPRAARSPGIATTSRRMRASDGAVAQAALLRRPRRRWWILGGAGRRPVGSSSRGRRSTEAPTTAGSTSTATTARGTGRARGR